VAKQGRPVPGRRAYCNAEKLVRKMRGGAQAHMLQADDGYCYVVKFVNNPQGRRIVVNEWIGTNLMRYLGIACPKPSIIRVSCELIENEPDLYIQMGTTRATPKPGWHFGSRFPGAPDRVAVYDFIPDKLLPRIENYNDFIGALCFDRWSCNVDARQAIFVRSRTWEYGPTSQGHPSEKGFVALMVDQGHVFNGSGWNFIDAASTGMYFRPQVYSRGHTVDDFGPWLDRIRQCPEEAIVAAVRELPPEWVDGDSDHLERLLDRLLARRATVAELVTESVRQADLAFAPGAAKTL
jgi:hypothetical protein